MVIQIYNIKDSKKATTRQKEIFDLKSEAHLIVQAMTILENKTRWSPLDKQRLRELEMELKDVQRKLLSRGITYSRWAGYSETT